MNKAYIVGIVGMIFLGAFFLFMNQKPDTSINDFETCAAAGNPVMESYPRQCRHGEQTFTEVVLNAFNDDTLGLSFNYPQRLGEMKFDIYGPGRRPGGESGKKFSGMLGEPSILELGGVSSDYRAGREGMLTDTEGFSKKDGKYYFKLVAANDPWGYEIVPFKVITKDFGEILLLDDQSFEAERLGAEGPYLGVGKGRMAGLVNLKGTEFKGAVLYNWDTNSLSVEEFEAILESIRVSEPQGSIPTSADNAPPGSIHNLPVPQAVSAVKKRVAQSEGVSEGLVIVLTAYEKEWSDGCLGLGGPAESCLAAITPGYEVTVQVKGAEQKYRTNTDGSDIRREQ